MYRGHQHGLALENPVQQIRPLAGDQILGPQVGIAHGADAGALRTDDKKSDITYLLTIAAEELPQGGQGSALAEGLCICGDLHDPLCQLADFRIPRNRVDLQAPSFGPGAQGFLGHVKYGAQQVSGFASHLPLYLGQPRPGHEEHQA